MKHSLQLRLSQHLTLTPQLQQSIRLLQLSTLELNQELERFLQDNPLLERDEGMPETVAAALPPNTHEHVTEVSTAPADEGSAPADSDTFVALDDAPFGRASRDDEDDDYPQVAAEPTTLRRHLLS